MVGYKGRLNLDRLSYEHRNTYHKERMVLPLYVMVDTYIFVLKLGPSDLLFSYLKTNVIYIMVSHMQGMNELKRTIYICRTLRCSN